MDDTRALKTTPAVPEFKRTLSGFGVIILTLSVLSPGASIFSSGGPIIQMAGTAAIAAFVLGGLINYFQTSMMAEMGSAYPTAGYDYAAIGHAIGDWAGATTYIGSLLALPLFLNVSAAGIAIYLNPLFPGVQQDAVTYVTIAVVTGLAMLNIRSNERITGLFMLIETAALLLVAGLGVAHIQPHVHELLIHPMTMQNGAWTAVGLGALALGCTNASWAIAGSSQALFFSEDMKRPNTVGRIMMLSFLLTVILETAPVIGTILGSHDLKKVLGANAPFEEFSAGIFAAIWHEAGLRGDCHRDLQCVSCGLRGSWPKPLHHGSDQALQPGNQPRADASDTTNRCTLGGTAADGRGDGSGNRAQHEDQGHIAGG